MMELVDMSGVSPILGICRLGTSNPKYIHITKSILITNAFYGTIMKYLTPWTILSDLILTILNFLNGKLKTRERSNFLNLTITINGSSRIETWPYQKPMNLYLYIPEAPAHPLGVSR